MLRKHLDDLLINRNFALFMGGALLSASGSWFLSVSIGWLVWDLGHSELLLGLANFAQMGPLLLFGLLGGAVADRVDRRKLLLTAQVFGAGASLCLAGVAWFGFLSVPVILLLLLLIGITQVFAWPTWSPFIADLVGPDRLRRAVALNSARFNLTRIAAPTLAGLLLAEVGGAPCVAVAAACQVSLVITLSAIRTPPRLNVAQSPIVAAIKEGLVVAWNTEAVREPLFIAGLIGMVILPYTVFLPAFAGQVLQIGPGGLGLLLTAVGLGAIAAAAVASGQTVARRPRQAQTFFTTVGGLALAVFSLSMLPPLSLVALFFVGFGTLGFLTTANATVQLAVPKHVVGRVIGIWTVLNAGTTPLGGIILGWLAERIGLPFTMAGAGLLCAGICLGIALRPISPTAAVQPSGSAE